ncbi:hypothetical protein HanHA89_Chr05g0196791 [Helianthus annuus]|nr:hypothetical protein HanHA89_Chr05g0196791 [Helianthus annuus]
MVVDSSNKVQSICNLANPLENFERTNVARCEFPFLAKSNHALPRGYLEKHEVTCLEFHRFASFVSITLLSAPGFH